MVLLVCLAILPRINRVVIVVEGGGRQGGREGGRGEGEWERQIELLQYLYSTSLPILETPYQH